MNALSWENAGGWMRWKAMPAAQRQEAEGRTADAIGALLNQPDRASFPDWPVVVDGAELDWSLCQEAWLLAQRDPTSGNGMGRFCAAIPAAMAQQQQRERAFLKGDSAMPRPWEPDRHDRSDHRALADLRTPLVLEAVQARPAAASMNGVAAHG